MKQGRPHHYGSHLLFYLFLCSSFVVPLRAQKTPPKVIPLENAAGYIGTIVKINAASYQVHDDGQTLSMTINRLKQPLTLLLKGESRKKIRNEIKARRELNTQIKSPLDTSITAVGKIISREGRLFMPISRASDIYLGADLKVQGP